jgi:excisionase family DNA binding protein
MKEHVEQILPLWKFEDVAEYLSVSPSHVRRLVSQRKIPSFKIGGSRRFDPLAVKEWVEAHETVEGDDPTASGL